MRTIQSKMLLYPHLRKESFEQFEKPIERNSIADDSPLYGETLDLLNKVLVRDPQSGHCVNLVSYVLSHTGASQEAVIQFIKRVPVAKSPQMTDEERLSLLVPRSAQSAGELKEVQKVLENYLSSQISADKAAKAAEDAAKAVRDVAKAAPGAVDDASADN